MANLDDLQCHIDNIIEEVEQGSTIDTREEAVKILTLCEKIINVCPICLGKGEYATGGSFGGAAQVHKCNCGNY